MSSIRRRSTVHDLASLRLHPDGSRVQNIASSSVNSGVATEPDVARASANTRSRLAKTTVQDVQGNWIARDAGGRAAVKYKRVRKVGGKGTEGSGGPGAKELDPEHESRRKNLDLDGETESEEGSQSVKDPRAKKRMKFLHDYSFLDTNSPPPQLGIPGPSNLSQSAPCTSDLPVPSSDLLKFIHYFASEHYAANGLLFDASSEFRKERKARKMQKLRKRTLKKMRRRDSESENDKNSGESEKNSDVEETDSSGEEEEQPKDERKSQRGAHRKNKAPSRDMYRAFDGSALMAIGMLLQEHILQTMSRVPPDGWEEEMLAHEANANVLGKGGRRKHRGRQKEKNDSIGVSELRNSVDEDSLARQEISKRDSEDSEESKEDSSSESSESSS